MVTIGDNPNVLTKSYSRTNKMYIYSKHVSHWSILSQIRH